MFGKLLKKKVNPKGIKALVSAQKEDGWARFARKERERTRGPLPGRAMTATRLPQVSSSPLPSIPKYTDARRVTNQGPSLRNSADAAQSAFHKAERDRLSALPADMRSRATLNRHEAKMIEHGNLAKGASPTAARAASKDMSVPKSLRRGLSALGGKLPPGMPPPPRFEPVGRAELARNKAAAHKAKNLGIYNRRERAALDKRKGGR